MLVVRTPQALLGLCFIAVLPGRRGFLEGTRAHSERDRLRQKFKRAPRAVALN